MRHLSIRWKLTLWYGGVLAAVLLIFGTTIFLTMRYQLLDRIDQGLAEELSDVRSEVRRAADPKSLHEWLDRRFARHEGFDFQITRPDGERFFVNPRLADKSLPLTDDTDGNGVTKYRTVRIEETGRWRIISERMPGPEGQLTVQVARSLAAYDHEMSELLAAFLLTGPLTLLLAVSGGYFLARRALAPVQRMAATADEITADRLDRRVEVANPDDELGALGQTFNRMIGRLERSFAEMHRFTADAAHELRTPLAVIHNEAEVALRSPRTADEYCRVLADVLEETDRLKRMADQLLFLSRQDAGLHPSPGEPVSVHSLVEEVVGHMRVVAQDKGVALALEENAPCVLPADPGQLRRVLYNLLDNAIKYTDPSGRVTVRSRTQDGHLTLSVEDTGVGIPPEHLPRVFDRFYRVDPARTGDGGAGLGLSICEAIVRGLGGSIHVESDPGRGTTVVIELPFGNPHHAEGQPNRTALTSGSAAQMSRGGLSAPAAAQGRH